MRRTPRVVAAIFGILVAGCASTPPTPAPPTAPASPTPLASASPRPSASPTSIDAGPFVIDLPAGWQVRTGLANPSGNWVMAYLSPAAIPGDCEPPAADGSDICHFWPVVSSLPGDIVVRLHQYGMPGSKPPKRGKATTVAGLDARVIDGPADDACQAIGGAELVRVNVPNVPGAGGWLAFEACIARGASASLQAGFDAIVHSARLPEATPSAAS